MSSEEDASGPETQGDLPAQLEPSVPCEDHELCSDSKEDECESMNRSNRNSTCNDAEIDDELVQNQIAETKKNFKPSRGPRTDSGCSDSKQVLYSGCEDSCAESSTDEALGDQHVSKADFLAQVPVLEMENPTLQDTSLELQKLAILESVPQLPPREMNNANQSALANASVMGKTSPKTASDINMPNLSQPPPPLPNQLAALLPTSLSSSLAHSQNSLAQQPHTSSTLPSHQQATSNIKSINASSNLSPTSSQFASPLQVSTHIPETNSSGNSNVTASPQQSPTSQTGPTVADGRGIRLVPNRVQALLHSIFCLQSPDDLQVHSLASQLRALDNEAEYRWLCEGMCSGASNNRRLASVVGAVCREAATHTVGSTKLRTMVFRTAQQLFANHEALAKENHEKFVTCAIFLGEIFYYIRSETGTPFAVLAEPLVTMLKKILQIYLEAPSVHTRQHSGDCNSSASTTSSSCVLCSKCGDTIAKKQDTDTTGSLASETPDTSTKHVPTSESPVNGEDESSPSDGAADHQNSSNIHSQPECKLEGCSPAALSAKAPQDLARHLDGDMMVVAKQLLQNGESLQRICPDGVADIVQAVTELLCRCSLSSTATLQVCAALAEMWPWLCTVLNPRTSHAVLASKMGLSLNL